MVCNPPKSPKGGLQLASQPPKGARLILKREGSIFIVLLFLDQFTKYIVSRNFNLFEEKVLIKNFLSLFYVHNTGVAFSLFNQVPQLVLILNFLFIVGLFVLYWRWILSLLSPQKGSEGKHCSPLSLGEGLGVRENTTLFTILLAGACGNFLDRLIHNYVIDFISVNLQFWTIPTFNLADIYIFCACVLLIVGYLLKK